MNNNEQVERDLPKLYVFPCTFTFVPNKFVLTFGNLQEQIKETNIQNTKLLETVKYPCCIKSEKNINN